MVLIMSGSGFTLTVVDRVMSLIGRGSFGTVVEAEAMYTNSVVAVKLLHRGGSIARDVRMEEKVYARLLTGSQPSIW